jgi:hypothetical protein
MHERNPKKLRPDLAVLPAKAIIWKRVAAKSAYSAAKGSCENGRNLRRRVTDIHLPWSRGGPRSIEPDFFSKWRGPWRNIQGAGLAAGDTESQKKRNRTG